MYILGENPAMSDPDADHAREALARLDLMVVQDIFLTETANYADVILPASALYEKTGTVSNTTGRCRWCVRRSPAGRGARGLGDHPSTLPTGWGLAGAIPTPVMSLPR